MPTKITHNSSIQCVIYLSGRSDIPMAEVWSEQLKLPAQACTHMAHQHIVGCRHTHTFLFVCAMWLLFEFTALDTVGFTEGHSTSCVKHDSCVLTKSCRNHFTAKHNKLRQFWVQMAIDRSVGCLQTTCMALSAAKDDEVKADPSLGWPRVQPSSKCIDFISLAKAAAA